MAYIGVQPTAGQYRKLDNISASFNGSTTSFTTSVGGTNVTAGTAQQLIVSLGGVIQQPDTDYTVSTNTITFTTAPTSGLDFFAILMGDALNTVTPSDGSVTTSKLAGSLSVGLTAGSASTPALFFTGDTNNGIFSPSTDAIAVTTTGSERLRVTSAGLVGIGTSSPNANVRLEVNGNISSNGDASPGGAGITIGDNQSGGYKWIQSFESHPLVLNPLGNNVGIGTTNPQTALHLTTSGAGQFRHSDGTRSIAVGSTGSETFVGSGANLTFLTNGLTSSDEKARIDTSGRLLVGTSSSIANVYVGGGAYQSPLQVIGNAAGYGNGLTQLNYSAGGYGSTLTIGSSKNATVGVNGALANNDDLGIINFVGNDGTNFRTGAYIIATVDGTPGTADLPTRLSFWTAPDGSVAPQERIRIKQNGFTKITSSGSFFSVTGPYHEILGSSSDEIALAVINTTSTNPYGIFLKFPNASPNDATRYFLHCEDSTGSRALIRSNGGLANYSANNANLSDRNVKKDITPAAGTWDCIKEWEIVNYRYKDQPDEADLNLGVIAQQVAESCPEVITVFSEAKDAKPAVLDDEGNEVEPAQEAQPEKLGVKEQQMYWMAIKALQEAQVRIEALEAEVAALKAQ